MKTLVLVGALLAVSSLCFASSAVVGDGGGKYDIYYLESRKLVSAIPEAPKKAEEPKKAEPVKSDPRVKATWEDGSLVDPQPYVVPMNDRSVKPYTMGEQK